MAHAVLALAYTACPATAKDGSLHLSEPVALILLQDGELRHHVVHTALTVQHGHLQRVQMSPSDFQAAPVMLIADELVGIGAATGDTLLIDQTSLVTDPMGAAIGASEFGVCYDDFTQGNSSALLFVPQLLPNP